MKTSEAETIYQRGFDAGLTGHSSDKCPYRLPEKKALWIRGLRDGQLKAVFNQLSPEDKQNARTNIAKLRDSLQNHLNDIE